MSLHLSGNLRNRYRTVVKPRIEYPGSIIAEVWRSEVREQEGPTGARDRRKERKRRRDEVANTNTLPYRWNRGLTRRTARTRRREDTQRVGRAGM